MICKGIYEYLLMYNTISISDDVRVV